MRLREFSPAEMEQASRTGYVRADHVFSRVAPGFPKNTYAVDDIDPFTHNDRDDGIWAERTTAGLRLYVSVADVASHVQQSSLLDMAAFFRAFTLYRHPAVDHAFPVELAIDRLSLEHQAARLALTVALDVNANFDVEKIRFGRTVVEPICCDYQAVRDRIDSGDSTLLLLSQAAGGLLGTRRLPIFINEDSGLRIGKEGTLEQLDPAIIRVPKIVETMMVLANQKVAEFAHAAKLPFLYRNFIGSLGEYDAQSLYELTKQEDKFENAKRVAEILALQRAVYSTDRVAHTALGLESYCHFTSPIRRYADLVNQRMIHYATDVVEQTAEGIKKLLPEKARAEICDRTWEHAPALIAAAVDVQQENVRMQMPLRARALAEAIAAIAGEGDAMKYQTLAAQVGKIPLPYAKEMLDDIAAHINHAMDKERKSARVEIDVTAPPAGLKRLLECNTQEDFASSNRRAFSEGLMQAAKWDRMTPAFVKEIVRRFDAGDVSYETDMFTILVGARNNGGRLWRGLKNKSLQFLRGALEDHESDRYVGVGSSIITMMQAQGGFSVCEAKASVKHAATDDMLHASQFRLSVDGVEYAPLEYSLGHGEREARNRAVYAFLKAVSMGPLVSADQSILPLPLYADLGSKNRNAMQVLKQICDRMELQLEERVERSGENSFEAQLIISGKGLIQPIMERFIGSDIDRAQNHAARQVLRDFAFRSSIFRTHAVDEQFPPNPIQIVQRKAAEMGWRLVQEPADFASMQQDPYTRRYVVKVRVDIPDEVVEVSNSYRNKEGALLGCYHKMVMELAARGFVAPENAERPPFLKNEDTTHNLP